MAVYHLARAADWQTAQESGAYRVSTFGRTLEEEGYVHACEDLDQLRRVAATYAAEVEGSLVVLVVDESAVGAPVVREVPEDADEPFPHIYGPIPVSAVLRVVPFEELGPLGA